VSLRRSILVLAVFTVVVLAAPARGLALAPSFDFTQLISRTWRTDDGLPQNSVTKVTQTPDGYLWLATEEKLARFDGVHFTVYDAKTTPELRSNAPNELFVDRSGVLWIGTNAGVTTFQGGHFARPPGTEALADAYIWAVAEDRDGDVWLGTLGKGLGRLHQGKLTLFTRQDGLGSDRVLSLLVDRSGVLWVGTNDAGLVRYEGGRFQLVRERGNAPSSLAVRVIYEDPHGVVWLGTHTGLFKVAGGEVVPAEVHPRLATGNISAILTDSQGNLFVGTKGTGFFRIREGRADELTTSGGLLSDVVWSLFEDHEHSLWVGTDGGGLVRFVDPRFTTISKNEGLPSEFVWSTMVARDGALWIGTRAGAARVRNGRVEPVALPDGFQRTGIFSIAEDRDGAVWLGTDGHGALRLEGGRFTQLSTANGLAHDIVRVMHRDRAGALWIGTFGGGVHRLRADENTNFSTRNGMPNDVVLALAEDADGSMWVGTDGGGLARVDGDTITTFSARDGLAARGILALHVDSDRSLWIGTFDEGVVRRRDGVFTTFTSGDGLPCDTFFAIVEDRAGGMWLPCNQGVVHVAKSAFDVHVRGERAHLPARLYGRTDGMRREECNGGQPGATRGADGRLFFPTIDGVAIIDPSQMRQNDLVPPVHVEGVFVDRRAASLTAGAVVGPGARDYEVRYTALSLVAPERVRFRYKLEGFDRDWIDAEGRRVAYYTNLPAADYRFRVVACNNDGIWNDAGASFAFRVEPHFYEKRAFLAFVALAVAALGVGVYRGRIYQFKARAQALEARVAERTTELRLALHKLSEREALMREDLTEAQAFQRRILQPPPATDGVTVAVRYEPTELVGGDVYDIHELAPGQLRVFIADMTGHGIQASLRTMVLKTEYDLLKARATRPDALLHELNLRIVASYPDLSMRASACCLDVELTSDGARLWYANAGHGSLLRAGPSGNGEIYARSPFLGMDADAAFPFVEHTLARGDRVLVFTDGLVEQTGTDGEFFGQARVEAIGDGTLGSVEVLADALIAALKAFADGRPLDDDTTLIVFEVAR